MTMNEAGGRLSRIDRSPELNPWHRAYQMTKCFLYWIPADGFPIKEDQRNWLLLFLAQFVPLICKAHGLRIETFLQFKTAMEMTDEFQENAVEFSPLVGLGRRPNAKITAMPTPEKLMEQLPTLMAGKAVPDIKQFTPDYCYWFRSKLDVRQREVFFGRGGLTMMFLRPDPATTPPPELKFSPALRSKHAVFQALDVDGLISRSYSMLDRFLPESKKLLGAGLEAEPQFRGLLFIVPLLSTADFFALPPGEIDNYFSLFDVYINESPKDEGILLASKHDLDDLLVSVTKSMRDQSIYYTKRG